MSDVSIIVSTNAKEVSSEISGLSNSITNSAKRAKQLANAFGFIDKSFNKGKIDAQQYSRLMQKLNKEESELYKNLGRTTSALEKQSAAMVRSSKATSNAAAASTRATGSLVASANAMNQFGVKSAYAGRNANRFGMYAQQVGYQVGDFVVQVQSGQNALVAFGQQGTQLAGLLPGVYGAILGIGLSLTTASLMGSGALDDLTFDFQRFKEDTIKFIEPIMPAINLLADVLSRAANRMVDGINMVINGFQVLKAVFGVLPSAFLSGVDWMLFQLRRLELNAMSIIRRVEASVIDLRDAITGTTTTQRVAIEQPDGSFVDTQIPRSEQLRFEAGAFASQAAAGVEPTGTAAAISDAISGIDFIDIRNLADYFGTAQTGAENLGGAASAVNDELTRMEKLADSIASSMGESFMDVVNGTKSVAKAFREMASNIIEQLFEVLVVQRMVGSAQEGTGLAGLINTGLNAVFSSFNANGNAFSGGNVIPFANGGVVGSPTMFPMAGGRTGLMGEAGPEAIMPLKRGADGKLGVSVEGGSGSVVVNNNINVTGGSDPAAIRMEVAKLMPQITNATKSAVIDARRRGGQMKAAFG